MTGYDQRIEQAKSALKKAEYILVGGGAGLSAAAGIEFEGRRFQENFAPFIKKYGMTDLYSSGFYPFPTEEEKWAYWAKHIQLNRYDTPAAKLYQDLFQRMKGKDYFVLTTNVDGQFVKAGFPKEKVFAAQGDYRFLQCAGGCHNTLYENEQLVKAMVEQTKDCKIPSALVPRCPRCGGNMEVNLRRDLSFVEDREWEEAYKRYQEFVKRFSGKAVVFLELGVGYNTPGIIRYPFEQMTYRNKNAVLIRLNRDDPCGAEENRSQTISFTENMQKVVEAL